MRRGSTLAVVLALYLALGSLLTAAAGVALASLSAASREYRRSQALALAEAAIEEARAGLAPHNWRALGVGRYLWSAEDRPAGRVVRAVGEAPQVGGAPVRRTVTAVLQRRGAAWRIVSWEDGA